LDFAGNIERHGPIDLIEGKKPKTKKGEAPTKVCPECDEILHASVPECLACGYEFPREERDIEASLEAKASTAAILSRDAPTMKWKKVRDVAYSRHKKTGSPDSMKVEYLVGSKVIREWVCFEHSGYARQKAVAWWVRRFGPKQPPETVADALEMKADIPRPSAVTLKKSGDYQVLDLISFEPSGDMVEVL